nr:MAG TPA: hypothetical protein [Caudoviricetes sp.]
MARTRPHRESDPRRSPLIILQSRACVRLPLDPPFDGGYVMACISPHHILAARIRLIRPASVKLKEIDDRVLVAQATSAKPYIPHQPPLKPV